MTRSFTIAICTRDRPRELEACLRTARDLDYPEFEILIVDNSPSDGQARELAKKFGARYIVEPVAGLSRARNRGAQESRSELIAYIDDDAVPQKNWLEALAREFDDPQVAVVTGRILPMRSETDAERFCVDAGLTNYGEIRRVIDRSVADWFEMVMFGRVGMGANMAFRRSVFDSWPGFDLRLGRGAPLDAGEEEHAFLCLIDSGWRLVYAPDATVAHPYPSSMDELRSRWLKTRASQVAFLILIALEQPSHLADLARYAARCALSGRGEQRHHRGSKIQLGISRGCELWAAISGVSIYWRNRLPRSEAEPE